MYDVCVDQLKEENLLLKRSIHELQRNSEANERRWADHSRIMMEVKKIPIFNTSCICVRLMELSEELLHRRRREEKEAQDLESMVQSVEQNLHLMTVCAVELFALRERSLLELKL